MRFPNDCINFVVGATRRLGGLVVPHLFARGARVVPGIPDVAETTRPTSRLLARTKTASPYVATR